MTATAAAATEALAGAVILHFTSYMFPNPGENARNGDNEGALNLLPPTAMADVGEEERNWRLGIPDEFPHTGGKPP